jgi:hypothetical protein
MRCINPPRQLSQIKARKISSCPLGISIKVIGRAFNRLKCLGGFLYLKPIAGCQILSLIFEFSFVEGVYKYPMENILGSAKFLFIIYFSWDIYTDSLHKKHIKYQN